MPLPTPAANAFIDALATLEETGLYKQLGFPTVYAYAEAIFRYHRSRVHEFIAVSRALASLPRIAAAFERGELSFHLASRLSAVATEESEGQWLDFLERLRLAAVLAELKEAKRKGRKEPQKDGFGLPGLPVKVSFELTAEEHALFEKGIQKARGEIAQSLEGVELEAKEVLLMLLRRLFETEPGDTLATGRSETGISPFTVVVHKCPECSRAALDTEAGKVELQPGALEQIEQIEQEAERVVPEGECDRPNTPALRRAVCQRDGGRCQNPCCGRQVGREGHGHHIELRSRGGRTELGNETFLCGLCRYRHNAGSVTHSSTRGSSSSTEIRCVGSRSERGRRAGRARSARSSRRRKDCRR